jgi:hypothetical protein
MSHIGASDIGSRCHIAESHAAGFSFVERKGFRGDKLPDRKVTLFRPQILPDGDRRASCLKQFLQSLQHLISFFAETDHETGLEIDVRIDTPYIGEKSDGTIEISLWPYSAVQAGNGFHIVVEDVGMCTGYSIDCPPVSLKIRSEYLDPDLPVMRPDKLYTSGELRGTAVGKIIPGYRRDDDIAKAQLLHRIKDSFWLTGIRGQGMGFA